MKTKISIQAIIAILLMSLSGAAVESAPSKRKVKKNVRPATAQTSNEEIRAILKQAQEAAERAQQEALQARAQSEELIRRLAQNTEEISRLRQTVNDFGSQLASLRNTESQPKTAPEKKNNIASTDTESQLSESDNQSSVSLAKLQKELDALKEQSEVNSAVIKEHAQTKVESDSKTRIKIYGTILANSYFNTRDSSATDVPLFAPAPSGDVKRNNVGASLRQSKIGFLLNGPTLGQVGTGPRLSAETEFDFWGGSSSDVMGVFRILTASVRLDWEHSSITVGQRPLMISPRNPSSIASVWFPSFTAAGNLWQWRPQIMAEHRFRSGDSSEVQIQGGVLMPFGESIQGTTIEGGPGYQSRIAFNHSLESDRKIEVGFGGYFHRRPFPLGRKINSYAITTDWAVPLGAKFEFSGEAYFGQANNLSEIPGSRTDRIYSTTGLLSNQATQLRGIFSSGGWAQMTYSLRQNLDFNLAYGQDDPRNRDILWGLHTNTTRFKNQSASANFIWNWHQNFLFSLEYRRFWTDYETTRQTSGHYNLVVGYTF